MKIAQVAPLVESVPPKLYGGSERVVSYLTEELVRQGHDVTLFASADSTTSARLVPCSAAGLRMDPDVQDPLAHTTLELAEVRERADEFDVLHFHMDYLHFPLFHDIAERTVTTMHGRLDLPDLHPVFEKFPDMPLVSISDDQRRPTPPLSWAGTVYHGLPPDIYPVTLEPAGNYFAFLGRISREKRLDRAIEIARRAGATLKVAAKVDKADQTYFEEEIAPLLHEARHVELVGEIGEDQKGAFLGNALALLFPIDWPEPFGLVMIEAMCCATPVIAWRCGSTPEVIDPGVSGFIVESTEEAVEAAHRLGRLPRACVRRQFERRFCAERMARDYVSIYESLARRSGSLDTPALRRR